MNETNKYQKDLIQKLRENSEEINSLKEKISHLENKNSEYINKILSLKLQIKELLEMGIEKASLSEQKKMCEKRIENLENEILDIINNNKTQNRQTEKELENEVIYYRGMLETGMAKIDAADNIIKLNNAQNKYIIDLEDELDKLKNNNDANICKIKIQHDLHYYNLKKKMMDYVKEIQHNMTENNKINLELNTKLGMLYKNQLLNELEYQAQQIKELIKIKEKYEKIIFVLNQELVLHKKVEKSVLLKNMKYANIFKDIDFNSFKECNSLILDNKNNKREKISLSEKKQKKLQKLQKYNFHFLEIDKNEDLDKAQLSIANNIINNSNYRECHRLSNNNFIRFNKKYYDEYISLKKLYDELLKENHNIKDAIITIKDKQKMFLDKYSGIIKLYKTALDELLSDEELKNKNINITKEIINSGNYDSFSKEQKQIIIITLIKNLLPLIDKKYDDNDIDFLKNSFQQSFNSKASTPQSTKIGNGSSINNISKLVKLNFRSVLDKKISIFENNSNSIFEKTNHFKTINNSRGINSSIDEKTQTSIKTNGFAKDKFKSRNRSFKLFKCFKTKSKDKPLRFVYIHNTFNKDYDIKPPVDTCLTKNNFLS